MYLKNVVLVWFICLSCNCKVVKTGCEVVWVNRNVTDSFRVGEDGCSKHPSVCTDYRSSCQSDGQCLCLTAEPNFRRPTQDKSYGCLSNRGVRSGIGGLIHCPFIPFQLIPSTKQPDSAAAQFTDDSNPNKSLLGCTLTKARAKFPNSSTETELQWLNESYVELTIVNNKTLHLQWKKSVAGLRGTIITLDLLCTSGVLIISSKCLRAKILGTWPHDVKPVTTDPTVTSFLPKTSSFAVMTTATTKKQESTCRSAPSSEGKNSQSNTLNVALVAVLAISLFVIVVLGIIVGFLWKKVQRMKGTKLKMAEISNIENQTRTNPENDLHNDGIYEESFSQSGHNSSTADHKYEEPSNYEPLRRNHLQNQSDEHNYQSLTTTQKGK